VSPVEVGQFNINSSEEKVNFSDEINRQEGCCRSTMSKGRKYWVTVVCGEKVREETRLFTPTRGVHKQSLLYEDHRWYQSISRRD
jgi:hypothetical protein